MLKPLNNHCLVEVVSEYSAVLRNDNDQQYQKGVLKAFNFTSQHLTTSTGHEIVPAEPFVEMLKDLVDKTVYWQQYADSGQVFEIDDKKYALIPFYRLVGFEE